MEPSTQISPKPPTERASLSSSRVSFARVILVSPGAADSRAGSARTAYSDCGAVSSTVEAAFHCNERLDVVVEGLLALRDQRLPRFSAIGRFLSQHRVQRPLVIPSHARSVLLASAAARSVSRQTPGSMRVRGVSAPSASASPTTHDPSARGRQSWSGCRPTA